MRSLLLTLLTVAGLCGAAPAHADVPLPVAPTFGLEESRAAARAEGASLVARLPAVSRRALVGLYVAVSTDASDPAVFAGCDDDGDYVLVVTDAMLALIADVARAQSFDDANGTSKVAEYAALVARAQVTGRRLLPPPPGFFTAEMPGRSAEARQAEALSFVMARALEAARSGDVTCRHPTATREQGDLVWTRDEDRRAREALARVPHGEDTMRDERATVAVIEGGRGVAGALGLLAFFEHLERERLVATGRFTPSYLEHHPSPVTRAVTVRSTEADRARARD